MTTQVTLTNVCQYELDISSERHDTKTPYPCEGRLGSMSRWSTLRSPTSLTQGICMLDINSEPRIGQILQAWIWFTVRKALYNKIMPPYSLTEGVVIGTWNEPATDAFAHRLSQHVNNVRVSHCVCSFCTKKHRTALKNNISH